MDRSPGDEWDLVIKVKYGNALRRIVVRVSGNMLSHTMDDLRMKIINIFKLRLDADIILTYTDVDGDMVLLYSDDELCEAAINQRLNPLRINVRLNDNLVARIDETAQNSSISLNHANKASVGVDEVFASVAKSLQNTISKLPHELVSKAAESAVVAANILMQLSKLDFSKFSVTASGDSGAHAIAPCKTEIKSADGNVDKVTNCGSANAMVSSGICSHEQTHSTVNYPASADAIKKSELCFNEHTHSKNNEQLGFVGNIYGLDYVGTPASSCKLGLSSSKERSLNLSCPTCNCEDNGKQQTHQHSEILTNQVSATCQLPMHQSEPRESFENCEREVTSSLSSNTFLDACSSNDDTRAMHYTNITSLSKSDTGAGILSHIHSPVATETLRLHSSESNTDGLPRAFHRGTRCNGCGMFPIMGSRYKSLLKEDYDLCDICFKLIGNMNDYTRIDFPQCRIPFSNGLQQYGAKLESRFIQDVTIPDGTCMLPLTPFKKIWRMHNSGSIPWSLGTKLVWVGGSPLMSNGSFLLEIPVEGTPVNKEVDIAAQFVSPGMHGRYVSYWRLASPSGERFGQHIWVLIQVGSPARVLGAKNSGMEFNLNLAPESSSGIWSEPSIIDNNAELLVEASPSSNMFMDFSNVVGTCVSTTPIIPELPDSIDNTEDASIKCTLLSPYISSDSLSTPSEELVSSTMCEVSSEVTDLSQLPLQPSRVSPSDIVEHDLLKALEEIGFRHVDLNKEALGHNNYDLDRSLDFLCAISDLGPSLAALNEMGFLDRRKNAKLLLRNDGNIGQVVLELLKEI